MKNIILLLLLCSAIAQASEPQKYNIEKDSVTVSGVSSGGAMAVQVHVAHSDWIQGAAILAAVPYHCARNSILHGLMDCFKFENSDPEVEELIDFAKAAAQAEEIAATENLRDDRVWLFLGSLDEVVARPVNDALHQFYQAFVEPKNISYITDKPFSHTMPTLSAGGDCAESASPYISDCDYDGAGAMLKHLYPNLLPPVEETEKLSGKLVELNQREITDTRHMGRKAFAYVPSSCASGEACKLHVSFHGCKQNVDMIGQDYIRDAGFNRWADSNKLIVLYPQNQRSWIFPSNAYACWDWWGYTGDDYAYRSGVQIRGVKALVNSLSVERF